MNTLNTKINSLVAHFFRHESGKMIAVLTRFLGSQHLIQAEDIVQDTLIEAVKNWQYRGIPENPRAWLYTVAKNKALNQLKRNRQTKKYISDFHHHNSDGNTQNGIGNLHFLESDVKDDQLRMMFLCCHPSLSSDSQIALILKTLCGFSVREIANAFLSQPESIHKRLVRARKKLREVDFSFTIPDAKAINTRKEVVLEAIYLLFNEGYSASTGDQVIRTDLYKEAIRLLKIIIDHPRLTAKSEAYALLALMQLNASRFDAREDEQGNILTLERQNRTLWNYDIMEEGFSSLHTSMDDSPISKYHILASISSYHCAAKDFSCTDWGNILKLYDKLLQIDSSPNVHLNRAIVVSQLKGPLSALKELEDMDPFVQGHLFYATKAELYIQSKAYASAITALEKAVSLAPIAKEKNLLKARIVFLSKKIIL